MGPRERSAAFVLLALTLAAHPRVVSAQAKVADPGPGTLGVAAACDLTGYTTHAETPSPAVAIPDFSPAGVLFGPLVTSADGTIFKDVALDLTLSHTWIGDLVVTLSYDSNCDGQPEDSTRVLCRPGRADCWIGSGFGSSKDFNCTETLTFSDSAAADIGGGTSPIPTGCYLPTGTGAGPLSVFLGWASGGCWWMNVSDQSDQDVGSVCAWAIHTRDDIGVPVARRSWGMLKSAYR